MQQLKFGTTTSFSTIFTTEGVPGTAPAKFYRPKPSDGYFIVGDYGQANTNPAAGMVVTVTEIDPDPANPMLAAPVRYDLVWNGTPYGVNGSFWQPVAPSNYVALGWVASPSTNRPSIADFRCLRFDQVKSGLFGPPIWTYSSQVSTYSIQVTNVLFAQQGIAPPTTPVYVPKAI